MCYNLTMISVLFAFLGVIIGWLLYTIFDEILYRRDCKNKFNFSQDEGFFKRLFKTKHF